MGVLRRSLTELDIEAVRAALATVEDPEIHRPITELGMVGEIRPERRGGVAVQIALTTAGCPLKAEVEASVRRAIMGAVAGVRSVHVSFTAMSESQRMAVARQLQADRPEGTNPFASSPAGRGPAAAVYAVASGKGGVGKSTVTANLAVSLAQQGKTVGVLDADVWGYSIPQLFGVRRQPVALNGTMLPVEAHGVRLMSTGFFVDDGEPVIWRGPMLHKALEQFLSDVHWGDLDILLLDLPPGTGDITMSVLELLPDAQLLAVTTPQRAAQTVAARVGRMARSMRMPVAGVVENMAQVCCPQCGAQSALFGAGGGEQLAKGMQAPLLARIPLDQALRESGDAGVPVVIAEPTAASAREFARLAAALPAPQPRTLVGRSLPLSVRSA